MCVPRLSRQPCHISLPLCTFTQTKKPDFPNRPCLPLSPLPWEPGMGARQGRQGPCTPLPKPNTQADQAIPACPCPPCPGSQTQWSWLCVIVGSQADQTGRKCFFAPAPLSPKPKTQACPHISACPCPPCHGSQPQQSWLCDRVILCSQARPAPPLPAPQAWRTEGDLGFGFCTGLFSFPN